MTILEIYEKYNIMPNLQLHQLRVAAVAEQICEASTTPVDKESIVLACLLHDMGNIVKFDLDYFPQLLEPEGKEYWGKIQVEFIKKYGIDDHDANLKIAQEIGVSSVIVAHIDAIGFGFWDRTHKDGSLEDKICAYADTRVSPFKVVSLEERFEEGEKRYNGKNSALDDKRHVFYDAMREIEKQIFAHTNIKPEDITDESIKHRIEKLRNTNIS